MSTLNSSEDYDRFFQTTDTLETQARRAAKSSNTHGRPVRLPSKLSAVAIDPTSRSEPGSALASRVYVSGSDGCVRRVRLPEPATLLKTAAPAPEDAIDLVLAGPKAPLTCLAILPDLQRDQVTVFAGCWDKAVYAWTVRGGKQIGEVRSLRNGHSDFVKCIAVHRVSASGSSSEDTGTGTLDILVSGSADQSIVFWEASSGRRLAQFKNFHRTSVNSLVVDPVRDPDAADLGRTFTLVSGASDGEVLQTEFSVQGFDLGSDVKVEVTGRKGEIKAHPTTVYGFSFCGEEADLLTASADGSATVIGRDEKGFGFAEVETRLKHEGHVRCAAGDMDGSKIYTGGRDENVKMWNAATGTVEVVIEGHFDEVTGLVVDGQRQHTRAITVSLDSTVRVWDAEEVERVRSGGQEVENVDESRQSLMTAEEEAELAELMDDDD